MNGIFMLFIIFIIFLVIQTLFYRIEENKLIKFIPMIIISIIIIFGTMLFSMFSTSTSKFPYNTIFSLLISIIVAVALIGDLSYIYINHIKEKN